MTRQELMERIRALTSAEEKLKRGDPAQYAFYAQYYRYLESIGRKDATGYYHQPDQLIDTPEAPDSDPFWVRLERSPYQEQFSLRRQPRYFDEPFSYGNFISLRCVYSGEMLLRTPTSSFTLSKNDLLLTSANFVHSQYLGHDEDAAFALIFHREYLLRSVLRYLGEQSESSVISQFILSYVVSGQNPRNYILFHGGDSERIPTLLEDLLIAYMEPTEHGSVRASLYLQTLLAELLECDYEYPQMPYGERMIRLMRILHEIDTHCDSVTLDSLSRKYGYSAKYLSRMIAGHTGRGFKELVFEKRMKHVCQMLKSTDYPITQIRERYGFGNETYFYQKFRELYGMNPAEYRAGR